MVRIWTGVTAALLSAGVLAAPSSESQPQIERVVAEMLKIGGIEADYAGEVVGYLVDEVDDPVYERTRNYGADHQLQT